MTSPLPKYTEKASEIIVAFDEKPIPETRWNDLRDKIAQALQEEGERADALQKELNVHYDVAENNQKAFDKVCDEHAALTTKLAEAEWHSLRLAKENQVLISDNLSKEANLAEAEKIVEAAKPIARWYDLALWANELDSSSLTQIRKLWEAVNGKA